jgi:hypothetical protein
MIRNVVNREPNIKGLFRYLDQNKTKQSTADLDEGTCASSEQTAEDIRKKKPIPRVIDSFEVVDVICPTSVGQEVLLGQAQIGQQDILNKLM